MDIGKPLKVVRVEPLREPPTRVAPPQSPVRVPAAPPRG